MPELHSTLTATIEQHSIARALLYQSARALMMDSQSYEAYLQTIIESNPFLAYQEDDCSLSSEDVNESRASFIEEISQEQGLQDVLLEQWNCIADEENRLVGALIISNLTPQGFHYLPLSELVTKEIPLLQLSNVARQISRLLPIGCATEDWIESLWVQSQEEPLHSEWTKIDITTFRLALQLWEKSGYNWETKSLLQVESEQELRSYLQQFTPYPGLQYSGISTVYNQADLILKRDPNGHYYVVLQTHRGVLQLNDAEYQHLLEQVEAHPDAVRWLRQQWREAGDVIAMHQYRHMQLLRVVNYIVSHQSDFLENHHHGLKGLQLQDIASALQMSLSTVSRIISYKRLATDQGLILLKKLLNRKQQHGSEVYSRQAIKNKVREIVYQYGKRRISDEKIRRLLQVEGIVIARRTINKYRHEDGL
ncbi:hypothetical protein PVA45_00780 [Entomospira entomophila]|uniref:RNA polymerase sigma-54 factor n=1 Tax=Entomospira entomophila TaxID=2719988 RepID=A0A968GCR2_9SPIO|nr:hypothetical protein [Entomospira entomophilus]NIZ40054.1 hypothetical protein [Entomospira entomophilus]WDI35615.1 hypothetical protein PVA45_00780 [Entomospira entomophilus]